MTKLPLTPDQVIHLIFIFPLVYNPFIGAFWSNSGDASKPESLRPGQRLDAGQKTSHASPSGLGNVSIGAGPHFWQNDIVVSSYVSIA
jgi:hypothetical protein